MALQFIRENCDATTFYLRVKHPEFHVVKWSARANIKRKNNSTSTSSKERKHWFEPKSFKCVGFGWNTRIKRSNLSWPAVSQIQISKVSLPRILYRCLEVNVRTLRCIPRVVLCSPYKINANRCCSSEIKLIETISRNQRRFPCEKNFQSVKHTLKK